MVSRDANPLIIDQISELNKATRHLNNAKLGINVDWLDFDGKYLIITHMLFRDKLLEVMLVSSPILRKHNLFYVPSLLEKLMRYYMT